MASASMLSAISFIVLYTFHSLAPFLVGCRSCISFWQARFSFCSRFFSRSFSVCKIRHDLFPYFFLTVLAACLKALLVGAPLDPTLRIVSSAPALIRFFLAAMLAYRPLLAMLTLLYLSAIPVVVTNLSTVTQLAIIQPTIA